MAKKKEPFVVPQMNDTKFWEPFTKPLLDYLQGRPKTWKDLQAWRRKNPKWTTDKLRHGLAYLSLTQKADAQPNEKGVWCWFVIKT
jgi:hypothetical protein